MSRTAVFALTAASLVGFATNSLLCRAALGAGTIDAASFTTIRIASGAAVLWLLARGGARGAGSWRSGIALIAYAAAFSFAYLRLTTATGALILFAAVQASMIGYGVAKGDRPRALEWLGLAIAAGGLVVLVLPGLAAPDPLGAGLMAVAGISWGVYSLRGRGATRPLAATADNFARALPFALVLLVAARTITAEGAVIAAASVGLASGCVYALWYTALPHLAPARAAIVQLSVPVIAASGGALVLGEVVTARFAGASAAVLGGILIALLAKRR